MEPKRLALKLNGMARRGSTPPDVAKALEEAAETIRSLELEKDYAVRLLKKETARTGSCVGCTHDAGPASDKGCGFADCDRKNNRWEWCGLSVRKAKQ